jgi:FkbM family methyltransferase
MQINKATIPLASALRQIGKRVRLRGWERLLRALFNPDKQQHVDFNVPFFGLTYHGYADNYIDWNVLFYGSYEAFELKLLAAIALRIDGAVFLDVGANVGHHALYMATHVKQVHAFEPNPALWPLIEEKLYINNVQNTFLHRKGLGVKSGKLPLYLSPESGGSSLIAGTNGTDPASSVLASIVRGDDFLPKFKIKKIDLIKLDVEGFEKSVIEGLRLYLERSRPIIMLEVSEVGKDQFGEYLSFVQTFPESYQFYFCQWHSNLINRIMLFPANEKDYRDFGGNVFCVPSEKSELFIEVAGIA